MQAEVHQSGLLPFYTGTSISLNVGIYGSTWNEYTATSKDHSPFTIVDMGVLIIHFQSSTILPLMTTVSRAPVA